GEMHAEGTAGEQGEVIPTLVSQMIIGMGRDTSAGFVDYSLGAPLQYVPMHVVKDMGEEELKRRFAGRVVLIGTLMGQTDRWRLPVKLLAVDPGRAKAEKEDPTSRLAYNQPGVLVHLQVLRSLLGPGLLHAPPDWARALLCLAAALVVFVRARLAAIVLSAVVAPALVIGVSLVAIVEWQILFPIASLLMCFWLG